ncbi:hypothetical protein N9O22_00030 [Gammaproteobacteria bacterium]|nr:hypothetical protein [Gammaproteobacteria bacterium]
MANFKDIKGGDPEGLQNHNKKKPEAKSEPSPMEKMFQMKLHEALARNKNPDRTPNKEYDFDIRPLEKMLMLIFRLSNFLEDMIEHELSVNGDVVLPMLELATDIRESLHLIIEFEMRHYFSTEELFRLSNKINRDAE